MKYKHCSVIPIIRPNAKGSRRNKFTVLKVEAPGRQDAEAQESAAAGFALLQGSRTGWIDVENVKFF